ncbi:t-SNARE syntaxin TLG2 [Lachancea thermotolerans CBS 6340]|uniref:KLTH0H13288p n=1 Tax=Lachancea thermotolerans (strain ATCC 56472 / CBS 6340 / NRRL Y-8284) TaxID=559295 RepID=C5E3G2_LACTC|nr:KLTH0H13288p [Lachancea thermotolerans CBS 6340]CAR30573.1 KLTH0H13288p [Lachancea thermotolerans CBS 6340]
MFRDRTNLFLSYRRTFPRNRYNNSDALTSFDLEENGVEESYPMIDSKKDVPTLSGQFLNLTQEVDRNLDEAGTKMLQLTKLYRKNALPGFEDKVSDEQEIEEHSYQIIKMFQQSYAIIKSLQSIQTAQTFRGQSLRKGDLVVVDNLQKHYASKIQSSSNKFRMLQNNYLKFLNKDDFKPLPRASTDGDALLVLEEEETNAATQQEIDSYSRQTLQRQTQRQSQGQSTQFLQREEEITQLARGVLEVSTIFREMQNLVIDQGTIIDRIDYNLENTVLELKGAQRELDRATVYQSRTQKCKVILLLSLVVITLFFFVMLKPHHHSESSKKDPPQPKQNSSQGEGKGEISDGDTKPKKR